MEKKGNVIDINKLRVVKDGEEKTPQGLFIGSDVVAAFAQDTKVFNKAEYYLSIPDTEQTIPVDGGSIDVTRISSFKIDLFDENQSDVNYTVSPSYVSENNTTQERNGIYTVTQSTSGFVLQGAWTQAANTIAYYSYTNFNFSNIWYMTASAGSSTVYPYVSYSYEKTPVFADGTRGDSESVSYSGSVSGSEISLSSVDGSESNGRIYSTGRVFVYSLGATPTTDYTEAAEITYAYATLSVEDVTLTDSWSGSAVVWQDINQRVRGDSYYSLSLSASDTNPSASTTYVTISVASYYVTEYTYTSGTPDNETSSVTASLSTSAGTLSSSSVSGSGSVRLTMGENTSTSSTRSFTVSGYNAGASDSVTVKQQYATVEEYWEDAYITGVTMSSSSDISAAGGSVSVSSVSWRRNYVSYNGATGTTTILDYKTGTATPSSISGSGSASKSGLKITASSLGTSLTSRAVVYTISSYTFSADGSTWTKSYSKSVYQQANTRTVNITSSAVAVSPTSGSIVAKGGKFYFIVYANDYGTYVYTSGSTSGYSSGASGTLSVSGSSGSVLSSSTFSTDENGKQYYVTVDGNPDGTSRTVKVTATTTSGQTRTATVSITQAASEIEYIWKVPTATSLIVGDIPADGQAINVQVNYSQVYEKYNVTTGTSTTTTHTGTVTVSSISGSGSASVSGGYIGASNLGETVKSRTKVYTITGASFTANGIKGTWGGSVAVYQEKNELIGSYNGDYYVTLAPNTTSISGASGSVKITVYAAQDVTYSYTSGDYTKTEARSASVSSNRTWATLSSTTVPDCGVTTLTFTENESTSSRSATVTATLGSKSTSTTITQAAVSYSFSSSTMASIGPAGGDMALLVYSTKNGTAFPFTTSNVSVSGLSGAYAKSVTSQGSGTYKLIIYVPQNTGAERTFSIKATQPLSGKTISWTATQTTGVGLEVATFTGAFSFSPSLTGVNYNAVNMLTSNPTPTMSATDTSKYKGGTCTNLTFKLVGTSTGVTYATRVIGDITVPSGGSTSLSSYSVVLNNSTLGTSAVKVEVWYDGECQQTCMILIPS